MQMKSTKPVKHVVAGTVYIGANPEYKEMFGKHGMSLGWFKVAKGVPFVKQRYSEGN